MIRLITLSLILCASACTPRLPKLPEQGQVATFYVEAQIKRGVNGRIDAVPYPGARVEVPGIGAVSTDAEGRVLLPTMPSPHQDLVLDIMVFPPQAGADEPPEHRYRYTVPKNVSGQVVVQTTVGARGAITGRVERDGSDGADHSGVIVFVDGVPGADDISGPNGEFFIYGVPAGEASVRFMYRDFTVAPEAFRIADVTPYQTVEIPGPVQLSAPEGLGVTAPISVRVLAAEGLDPADQELVLTPIDGAGEGVADARVVPVPASGELQITFEVSEPHQVLLRAAEGKPSIKPARFSHVVPGLGALLFYAQPADEEPSIACSTGVLAHPDGLYSCGDLDGDGFDDAIDADDDGDGLSDLEELTPGSDGTTSDHREGSDTPSGVRTSGDPEMADRLDADDDQFAGILGVLRADADARDHQIVSEITRVIVDSGTVSTRVRELGYAGHSDTLMLMLMADCETAADCEASLAARPPEAIPLPCVNAARGRKNCPGEAIEFQLDRSSLLWVESPPVIATLTCGDGVVQAPEQCDDANQIDTDACTENCRNARCGDATVRTDLTEGQPGFEECDDGNRNNDDTCTNDCRIGGEQPVTIRSIVAGGYGNCALFSDGVVKCWGANDIGQLAHGSQRLWDPTIVDALMHVVQIDLGPNHGCAVTNAGQAVCWGQNTNGKLGTGNRENSNLPMPVQGFADDVVIQAVAVGHQHSCARDSNDWVTCWGDNGAGQLGHGENIPNPQLQAGSSVLGLEGAVQMSGGGSHHCAIVGGGGHCWGENSFGQLGDNTSNGSSVPSELSLGNDELLVSIAAGYKHSCALSNAGEVYCWGLRGNGALGDGQEQGVVNSPALVADLANVTQIDSHWEHSCARNELGQVHCWGSNVYLQAGQPGAGAVTAPTRVALGSVVQVTTGTNHSCALMEDGGVMCWGQQGYGQLGIGEVAVGSRGPIGVNFGGN